MQRTPDMLNYRREIGIWVSTDKGLDVGNMGMPSKFKPGEAVIYRVTKRSTHPGPRATEIRPAKRGDSYTYAVEKFWRVKETLDDGTLVLRTRRGKERTCSPDDPNIRRPGFLARWLYADRFPQEAE